MNYQTLVLRYDWTPVSVFPLETIPAEDAITRVLNGTCEVIADYGVRIKTQNPKTNLYWPSVIKRVRNDDKRFKGTPPLQDEYLYYRDHAVCAYCGKQMKLHEVTMDHVIPRSKGGQLVWNNTVLSCSVCNSLKGNNLPTGRWAPRIKPYEPTMWDLLKARKKFPITVPHESWIPFLGNWESEVRISA